VGNEILDKLRAQFKRVYQNPFYGEKYKAMGMSPDDLQTMEDFSKIPFTGFNEFEKEIFEKYPPYGRFFDARVTRINFTTSSKGLMPVLNTEADLMRMNQANALSYRMAGLDEEDTLLCTFSCHMLPAGLQIQGATETLGAKAIAVGPGNTDRVLEIVDRFNINALYTNPSFAIKLSELGMKGIKVLFGGGEPFSSVKGYKDKVRDALGQDTVLIDAYALSHSMPTARECGHEKGLHVIEDLIYAEIIDPQTGEVLPDGQQGELVITQFYKEAMPLFRYRTGDLSMLIHDKCECGNEATLPRGVFGRVDNMIKVKGVKVYPLQVGLVLKSYEELTDKSYRIIVTQKASGGDNFALQIKAKSLTNPKTLEDHLKEALLIRVDELEFVTDLSDGPIIDDRRWG
jgi:phenylacetate-coenzyme A ligase PaaK-like adenylate-forming protein